MSFAFYMQVKHNFVCEAIYYTKTTGIHVILLGCANVISKFFMKVRLPLLLYVKWLLDSKTVELGGNTVGIWDILKDVPG